jgi:hypothetical protein
VEADGERTACLEGASKAPTVRTWLSLARVKVRRLVDESIALRTPHACRFHSLIVTAAPAVLNPSKIGARFTRVAGRSSDSAATDARSQGAGQILSLGRTFHSTYNRFRQNNPLKPSESCLRPLALLLTLAPRRPRLTPAPRFDRFRNSPGASRLRFLNPSATGHRFSQAIPSLSRSRPLLWDIATR